MKKNKSYSLKSIAVLLLIVAGFILSEAGRETRGDFYSANFYTTTAQCEAAYAGSMNALLVTWGGYQNRLFSPTDNMKEPVLILVSHRSMNCGHGIIKPLPISTQY